MADDLRVIADWAGALLARLSPAARRGLLRQLATELRRSQQQRIAAQRAPDGSAYAPRRPQRLRGKVGRIRRRAMFTRLRTVRWLRTRSDTVGLSIGFAGRVARIARVHQYGGTDTVRPGGPSADYTARPLLGFSQGDLDLIADRLLQHLQE